MTPLSVASDGLLDRGALPSLAIATLGFLREPIPDVVVARRHGAVDWRKADEHKEAFERTQLEDAQALRASIERAFATVSGDKAEPDKPLTKPERRQVAKIVMADADLTGAHLALSRIDRLIRDYEQAMRVEQERILEEEAIVLLFATMRH